MLGGYKSAIEAYQVKPCAEPIEPNGLATQRAKQRNFDKLEMINNTPKKLDHQSIDGFVKISV